MLNWITTLIGGDYNKKQLQQMRPIVTEINEWFAKYETLSDEEIKAKTPEFKERITK